MLSLGTPGAPSRQIRGNRSELVAFRLHLPVDPPIGGRVQLASTADRAAGLTHFVAHAVLRKADSGA